MSGGSWDYVYRVFEEVAERLSKEKCPHRRALGLRMAAIADAMYYIELVDSGDKSPRDEIEAIKLALGEKAKEEDDKIS